MAVVSGVRNLWQRAASLGTRLGTATLPGRRAERPALQSPGQQVYRALRRVARERIGTFRTLFLIRLAQWPLRAALRPVVSRWPRKQKLVAFGGWHNRFADNSAYLYLHMSRQPGLTCVWISGSREVVQQLQDRGLAAAYRWSLPGIRVALRASWYVYSGYRDDVNAWLSRGATALNLWHGVGLKRIQRDAGVPQSGIYSAPEGSWTARLFADDRLHPDYVLSTSPMMSRKFAADFDVPVERCLEFGYPRNDHLVAAADPPAALVDPALYAALRSRRPVVGYFPTFRDDQLMLPFDLEMLREMAQIVGAQGGVLLFKAHGGSVVPATSEESLVVLPSSVDLNAYLVLCDVLITDYSSAAYDYLLLDRPIISFCPDFELYRRGRGFYFEPTEMMPGVLCQSKDELYGLLGDLSALPHEDGSRLRELFWSGSDSYGAAARVSDFIRGCTSADRTGTLAADASPGGHAAA